MLLVAYEQCCDMVLKLIKCDFSFALLWSGTFHTSLRINPPRTDAPSNIQVTRGSFCPLNVSIDVNTQKNVRLLKFHGEVRAGLGNT